MKGLTLNALGKKEEAHDHVRRGLREDLRRCTVFFLFVSLFTQVFVGSGGGVGEVLVAACLFLALGGGGGYNLHSTAFCTALGTVGLAFRCGNPRMPTWGTRRNRKEETLAGRRNESADKQAVTYCAPAARVNRPPP